MVAYGTALLEAGESNLGFAWLSRAAGVGDHFACYKVAECYEEGRGVPRDTTMAAEYYNFAVDFFRYYASPGGTLKTTVRRALRSFLGTGSSLPPSQWVVVATIPKSLTELLARHCAQHDLSTTPHS